jgi:hypothetical protein
MVPAATTTGNGTAVPVMNYWAANYVIMSSKSAVVPRTAQRPPIDPTGGNPWLARLYGPAILRGSATTG